LDDAGKIESRILNAVPARRDVMWATATHQTLNTLLPAMRKHLR
jgi:hypothetical protein